MHDVSITAPFGGGVLTNTVSAPGFTAFQPPPVSVNSPSGGIVITEMVLDPQQDWNDSAGGNGIPFDATPGSGAVDADDIWVEIRAEPPARSRGLWTAATRPAQRFSKQLGPLTTTSQTRLKTGLVSDPQLCWCPRIDKNGFTDKASTSLLLTLSSVPRHGPNDESLTWTFPDLLLPLQQFVRRVQRRSACSRRSEEKRSAVPCVTCDTRDRLR